MAFPGFNVNVRNDVIAILRDVLSLDDRSSLMQEDSPLLGAIPELDSMSIVAVITTLEEHFGFTFDDDELDASCFSTVGALTEFVTKKLTA